MEQVKINTMNRAIQMLNAAGVQYAVIDFDGNKHGTLNVTTATSRKKEGYEWGSMSKYLTPFIEQVSLGSVVTIDTKDFDVESLRGTAASMLNKRLGAGGYTTAIDREKKTIEILGLI